MRLGPDRVKSACTSAPRGAEESIESCFEYKLMGESDLCHVWQKIKFTAAMLPNILM